MLKRIDAAKLATTLIVWALPFAVFAQDVPLPNFIKLDTAGFPGLELYLHSRLYPSENKGWIDKETDEQLDVYFYPMIRADNTCIESESDVKYLIGFQFIALVGDATLLDRFEIKADSDAPAQIIQFDSWTQYESSRYVAKANNGVACGMDMRIDQGHSVHIIVRDGPALPLMEKMAYQSDEKVPTISLVTDEEVLTFDVPISVSKPLREFLEWAEDFYKAKGLTWPGDD